MNEKEFLDNPNPYLKSSFFNKITFSWVGDLLSLGRKKQLELTDLYSPLPEDETKYLTDELEAEWQKEIDSNKENPTILKPIIRLYGKKLSWNFLFIAVQELMKIFQPLLITLILKYFSGSIQLNEALIYAGIISVFASIGGILHHPYYYFSTKFGMQVRLACSGLIYRKILRLGITSFETTSSGDICNLLAVDMTRIETAIMFLTYIAIGPIQSVIVVYVILVEIGITFLAGFFLLFAILPIKAIIARIYNTYRLKCSQKSDERISILTEILSNIKLIKMYCWEVPFSELAKKSRDKELNQQLLLNLLQSITLSIDNVMATLMTLFNIIFFVLYSNAALIPNYIVFSLGFYMRLCYSIGYNFTRSLTTLINGLVSIKRLNEFLLKKELDINRERFLYDSSAVEIRVEDFSFAWSQSKGSFQLKDISLNVENGELLAIIGPVGSGKSTLLMGLMGELENYTGKVDVKGKIAYIAQQPWIFTASIRQNILFGNEYNKEKFDKVVEVCSLKKDLETLPYGENTLVGEKGINLSGGQRQRISMARALYSDADIYFFDDSLSAVDGVVGKSILKNCINGYLKSKIRVLVTHHAQHLEYADNIIVLKHGEIEAQGNFKRIQELNLTSVNITKSKEEEEEDENNDDLIKETETDEDINNKIKMITKLSEELKSKEEQIKKDREEYQQSGSVGWRTYYLYFTGGGKFLGIVSASLVVFLFIASQALMIVTDYWLSYWATKEENYNLQNQKLSKCFHNLNSSSECNQLLSEQSKFGPKNLKSQIYPDRDYYFRNYIIFASVSLLVTFFRSILYFIVSVIVSRKAYSKMFTSVKNAPIRFFELNPLGRILNRFTKDTNNMDDMICIFIFEFLHLMCIISGAIIVPLIVNYWIIIILIPVSFVFVFFRNYFITSGRQLKRLENISRSPIFVHTNSTIEGISTIRSFGNEEILCKEFEMHNNNHTRTFFDFFTCQRWFGLRLDLLCSLLTVTILFFCIFMKDKLGLTSGEIGLLMCYLFQLFDLFQWCVIMTTIIENLMTSVERIIEYTQLKSEHPIRRGKKSPNDWPMKGQIIFKHVSLKYDPNLPEVLKDISLNISPSQKIGIIGRTGAGKSSFFQTLFRMYEPNGTIFIDGIDIKSLNLEDLRSKLTIIPQEPVLFSGTIRFNLDPFNKFDDLDLWNALEAANLKYVIQEMKGRLDSYITPGGSNLSVGQKQLICLARAILKKTKILIIDEATANVDFKTDAIIQKTIREQFKECTVLTIAHRLSTVVDNDKILCLSEGEIKNFNTPKELFRDKTSVLFELASKLSKSEKNHLYEIINQSGEHEPNEKIEINNLKVNKVTPQTTESVSDSNQINSYVNYGATFEE